MRIAIAVVVLLAGAVHIAAEQERVPPSGIYRGPFRATRPVTLVEPANGLPLEFRAAMYGSNVSRTPGLVPQTVFEASVKSRTVRPVPISGITLRMAVGPTTDGMITFRLRPRPGDYLEGPPPTRLTLDSPPTVLRFAIAEEDPAPGVLAMSSTMKLVFTIERIDSDEGTPIFDNPDATELLWEALGKPTLNSQ
jgi:hypothetical protein